MKLNWSFSSLFRFSFFLFFVLPNANLYCKLRDYTEYSIIPDFIWSNYQYIFKSCFEFNVDACSN